MESIYYVMAWACHRKCRHCYEDRFRPYVRAELAAVVAEAEANYPRIIAHLPNQLGRIILSGGEALLEATRERVTYPVIEALHARYGASTRIVLQTTGDLLTPEIVRDLLDRKVWMISVAGVDDFHVGMEGAARQAVFVSGLTAMFEAAGMRASGREAPVRLWHEESGPVFSFFGATPASWIGKLWPRGRGWMNSLSTATMADNFCNRWSGGLGFLNHNASGSEVSIEPDGSVYPCCVKTRQPVGNILDVPLVDLLDGLGANPVYRAINEGRPERMGVELGWTEADFLEKCRTKTPDGREYANLCIGCDRFHDEVLARRI